MNIEKLREIATKGRHSTNPTLFERLAMNTIIQRNPLKWLNRICADHSRPEWLRYLSNELSQRIRVT